MSGRCSGASSWPPSSPDYSLAHVNILGSNAPRLVLFASAFSLLQSACGGRKKCYRVNVEAASTIAGRWAGRGCPTARGRATRPSARFGSRTSCRRPWKSPSPRTAAAVAATPPPSSRRTPPLASRASASAAAPPRKPPRAQATRPLDPQRYAMETLMRHRNF